MTVFHPPIDLPPASRPRSRRPRRRFGLLVVLLIILMIGGPMVLQVLA
jgi:hypothetical protein